MNKKYKIQLGIFIAMLVIPEILFSFVLSSLLFLVGASGPYLISYFVNPQFLTDNQSITFAALIIEMLGLIGLTKLNHKFNKSKFKFFITLILSMVLIFLALVFYSIFTMRNGIGF